MGVFEDRNVCARLRRCLGDGASIKRHRATFELALSCLPPGALMGENSDIADAFVELGYEVPASALRLPPAQVGSALLVSSDGVTHRALYVGVQRGSDRTPVSQWLDGQAQRAVDDALTAARSVIPFEPPELCDLGPAALEPDWSASLSPPVSGGSVGLPVALALLSDWLDQPLRLEVAATGRVVAGASRLLPVRRLASKALALNVERPWVEQLIVPRGSTLDGEPPLRPRIVEVDDLAEAAGLAGLDLGLPVRAPLEAAMLLDAVDELMRHVRRRTLNVRTIQRRANSILRVALSLPQSEAIDGAELHALSALIEYQTHAADALGAIRLIDEVNAIRARRPSLESSHAEAICRAQNAHASALIDVPQLPEARAAAEEALLFSKHLPSDSGIRARGTLGRIAAHELDLDHALPLLRALVAEQSAHPALERESAIPRTYLIGVLALAGQLDEARAELAAGRALNARLRAQDWKGDNSIYLDLSAMRIEMAAKRWADAIEIGRRAYWNAESREPGASWPQLGIAKRLIQCWLEVGNPDEAVALLRFAHDHADRSGHPLIRRLAAHCTLAWVIGRFSQGCAPEETELTRIRAACVEVPVTASAPFVPSARKIASGDVGMVVLREMYMKEFY